MYVFSTVMGLLRLGGYVFDATRSYDLIWYATIALGVMAAALHWPINDRQIMRVAPIVAAA